jgi:hypothetical protein
MSKKDFDVRPVVDPEGQLERAFIDDYLRMHGHEPAEVRSLPEALAKPLLEAASIYAAGKLAEFEARAHYVHDIHNKD